MCLHNSAILPRSCLTPSPAVSRFPDSLLPNGRHRDGNHLPRGDVDVQNGRSALALPGRHIGEADAVLSPEPAVLVDVAEHVQQWADVANRSEQVLAALPHGIVRTIAEAERGSVRDQHVNAVRDQGPPPSQRFATRQVERPVVKRWLPRTAPEPNPFDRYFGILEVDDLLAKYLPCRLRFSIETPI